MNKNKKSEKFKKGLKKNSLIIMLLAALIAAWLCFCVDTKIKNGDYLKIGLNNFVVNADDDTSYIAYSLYEINAYEEEKDRVYLLGGSTSIFFDQGLVTFEDYFAEEGYEADFLDLSCTGQTLLEALLIANNLPDGEGVAVIVVNPRKLKKREIYKVDRFPVDRLETLQFIKDAGFNKKTNIFFSNLVFGDLFQRACNKFFLSHMVNFNPDVVRLLPYEDENYREADSEDYRFQDGDIAEVQEGVRTILEGIGPDDFDIYNTVLSEIARVLDEKGYDLLIVSLPISELIYEGIFINGESLITVFDDCNAQIAEENPNVYYTTFAWDIGIEDSDFSDGLHLGSPEKRDALRRGLANAVAEIFEKKQ